MNSKLSTGSWNFQNGHHLWQQEGDHSEAAAAATAGNKKRGKLYHDTESRTMQSQYVCFCTTGTNMLQSCLGKELEQE